MVRGFSNTPGVRGFSRETLGYTKHQSVILFNRLIEKGLIEKKGKSSSTTYQLKKI